MTKTHTWAVEGGGESENREYRGINGEGSVCVWGEGGGENGKNEPKSRGRKNRWEEEKVRRKRKTDIEISE